LELGESDPDALRAAAMLHDIGKLAVPEHIISKPGKTESGRVRKDEDSSYGRGRNSGAGAVSGKNGDFLAPIAAARQEVQLLFELTRDLGNSLSLE
jgi:hypothetical protein